MFIRCVYMVYVSAYLDAIAAKFHVYTFVLLCHIS